MSRPKFPELLGSRDCIVCGCRYTPRTYKQINCSPACKIVAQIRRAAERYANDPAYHAYINWRNSQSPSRLNRIVTEADREYRQRNKHLYAKWNSDRYQQLRLVIPWGKLVDSARVRAKRSGIPFDITREWAEARWTGRCELTDIPFILGRRRGEPRSYSPSIDRINPTLGYTTDNCRFILWSLNLFRNNSTDDDMYRIAKALISNRPSPAREAAD